MKDYTKSNSHHSLPEEWNDCLNCGAGIVRKTNPSQLCRNCHEAQVMRESRQIFVDHGDVDNWTSQKQLLGSWDSDYVCQKQKNGFRLLGRN